MAECCTFSCFDWVFLITQKFNTSLALLKEGICLFKILRIPPLKGDWGGCYVDPADRDKLLGVGCLVKGDGAFYCIMYYCIL